MEAGSVGRRYLYLRETSRSHLLTALSVTPILFGQLQLGHAALFAQGGDGGAEGLLFHRVCTPLLV